MDRGAFDQLVERAFQRIPLYYRKRIENVAIVVEQEPSPAALRAASIPPGSTLLGLYQGIPAIKRSWGSSSALPDRISLYQGPLERMASSSAELERLVEDTLWHEIGHYFGLNEAEIRRVEARRARQRKAELRRRKPAG
jgi:predicted Zn-dependent protease with MMP-like domain